MTSLATIPPLILLLLFTCSAVAQVPTVYEVLQKYDLPVGLLPTNITSYTLNKYNGEFHVNLGQNCTFFTDGYEVKYKPTISGVIRKDKVTKLKGVSVRLMVFWVNIVQAIRDEDEVDISIGLLKAGFDIEALKESPQCGCGFNCVASEIRSREKMPKLSKVLDWSM